VPSGAPAGHLSRKTLSVGVFSRSVVSPPHPDCGVVAAFCCGSALQSSGRARQKSDPSRLAMDLARQCKLIFCIAFWAIQPSNRVDRVPCQTTSSPMPLILPRPRTTVVYKDLPEGAILFCTSTEVYFSLNPIGAKIWKLLPPVCANEEEVVAQLSAEYPDINLGKISADVRRLLEELVGNGLADLPRAA
jgi:hypothetical protein